MTTKLIVKASFSLVISLLLFSPGYGAGTVKEAGKPIITPVPFTSQPAKRQWRIGFKANDIIDAIEIPPSRESCDECDQFSAETWPAERTDHLDLSKPYLLPLQYKGSGTIGTGLVNPEKWFVLDLSGNKREITVNRLAAVFSQESSGCCYMTTEALGYKDMVELDSMGPSAEKLFVAFTSSPDPVPVIKKTDSKPKRFFAHDGKVPENLLAMLDLPAVKKALGEKHQSFKGELGQVYTQDFQACIDKSLGVEKLTICGWATADFMCAFGIFRKDEKGITPVAVYFKNRQAYNDNFLTSVEAAADLDGNGTDEIITSVSYYEGNAFKVFSIKDGQIVQLYETGYYGL